MQNTDAVLLYCKIIACKIVNQTTKWRMVQWSFTEAVHLYREALQCTAQCTPGRRRVRKLVCTKRRIGELICTRRRSGVHQKENTKLCNYQQPQPTVQTYNTRKPFSIKLIIGLWLMHSYHGIFLLPILRDLMISCEILNTSKNLKTYHDILQPFIKSEGWDQKR